MIKLNNKVRNVATGFTAFVVARCEFVHGNFHTKCLVRTENKPGTPMLKQWFYESHLEVIHDQPQSNNQPQST